MRVVALLYMAAEIAFQPPRTQHVGFSALSTRSLKYRGLDRLLLPQLVRQRAAETRRTVQQGWKRDASETIAEAWPVHRVPTSAAVDDIHSSRILGFCCGLRRIPSQHMLLLFPHISKALPYIPMVASKLNLPTIWKTTRDVINQPMSKRRTRKPKMQQTGKGSTMSEA